MYLFTWFPSMPLEGVPQIPSSSFPFLSHPSDATFNKGHMPTYLAIPTTVQYEYMGIFWLMPPKSPVTIKHV